MALVLAHRGARLGAPENTLDAFALARSMGADGVELDVHRCADGHLVIHHDAHAPGLGVLAELELDAIRTGRPAIPTLPEALEALAGLVVNVEIKNLPGEAGYDPQHRAVATLLELLEARGGSDDVLVSSFNIETIDRVRALDPAIPTGYLTFGMEPGAALGIAVEHGHRAWHPDRATVVRDAPDIVAAAHGAGLEVNVWTVNDPVELVVLSDAGADALITDAPDVAVRTLRAPRG